MKRFGYVLPGGGADEDANQPDLSVKMHQD
jgi:hypothetical protein